MHRVIFITSKKGSVFPYLPDIDGILSSNRAAHVSDVALTNEWVTSVTVVVAFVIVEIVTVDTISIIHYLASKFFYFDSYNF